MHVRGTCLVCTAHHMAYELHLRHVSRNVQFLAGLQVAAGLHRKLGVFGKLLIEVLSHTYTPSQETHSAGRIAKLPVLTE